MDIDKIIKKKLNIKGVNNDTIIDDPFMLAAVGVQIEEESDIVLPDEEFMANRTIGDIKGTVKWL